VGRGARLAWSAIVNFNREKLMARLTIGQKADRVLKLLFGLRNPRIAAVLKAYGFTKKDLDEGWKLLAALTENRLDNLPPPPADPTLLVQLDEWENKWFPIAKASLQFRYPAAYAWLFANLHQTDGLDVIVSVGTFVRRIGELATQKDVDGAKAARKLLTERGLGDSVIGDATALINRTGSIAKEPAAPSVSPEQAQAAEDALWHWYLEWSGIARAVITNRRQLRDLGFLQSQGGSASADATDAAEPDATGATDASATMAIAPAANAPPPVAANGGATN
jgi:hypothetical protein